MLTQIRKSADQIFDQLVAWRRHLHAHPELSGAERETAAYIAAQLRKMDVKPREGVGGHGVTVDLGPAAGPTLLLRADIDALPIQEETGLEFASKAPGCMHACGHDAHTAMLLGATRLLAERARELPRRVRVIFQPHEEKYPGGAQFMIRDGVLDGVEAAFGIHISSQLPTGQIGLRSGPFMAAINELRITVEGQGGHAAMPEQCVDPIVAAAQVILALQTVVSRSISMTDSAVVSVTRIQAGVADNIIPGKAELQGTIRTLSESVRERVCQQVVHVSQAAAAAHGARCTVNLAPGYPVLVNDATMIERTRVAARGIGVSADQIVPIPPIGGGEDFAYFSQKVPSAFAFLGASNADCAFPHHHPRFNIDEAALPIGAALHAAVALGDAE